jgi:enamine deaminase RidA (YjgF/YER057c/UK114 family)
MSVERFGSGGPYEEIYGYSRLVKVGPWLLTAGCTSTVDGEVAHIGDEVAQTRQAFFLAFEMLAGAGAQVDDIVRTRMYVAAGADPDAVGRTHGELFATVRPVSTLVIVASLIHPDLLVEVEVEAYLP